MDRADSVHSTPLTSTSPERHTLAQKASYPTGVSREQIFQAKGRLRKEARDEIDRLIQFLDKTDDYVSRELEHEDGNAEPGRGTRSRLWVASTDDRPFEGLAGVEL